MTVKEYTINPPITWSELTAVTVEADNCPILKDERQTPEDISHTRTVCEKQVIQSKKKYYLRYKGLQLNILISILVSISILPVDNIFTCASPMHIL